MKSYEQIILDNCVCTSTATKVFLITNITPIIQVLITNNTCRCYSVLYTCSLSSSAVVRPRAKALAAASAPSLVCHDTIHRHYTHFDVNILLKRARDEAVFKAISFFEMSSQFNCYFKILN